MVLLLLVVVVAVLVGDVVRFRLAEASKSAASIESSPIRFSLLVETEEARLFINSKKLELFSLFSLATADSGFEQDIIFV